MALQGGDHRALGTLYDRYAPALLGLAFRIVQDRSDAEDLVHDVFLEAWRKVADYQPDRASVRVWLLMRLRSRAVDRVRSLAVARRYAAQSQSDALPEGPAGPDPASSPDQRRARAALAALSEPQRTVLEFAYFQGLTCAEIAARSGTPLGTVKSRLAAGLRELRRRFDTAGAQSR